jgi:hypothetical protein
LFPLLLPDPTLRLDLVAIAPPAVTLALCTTAPVSGPLCAQPARHVPSPDARSARDRPIHGRPAVLRLTARCFFCRNADCSRRVFCAPIPRLLAQHDRGTARTWRRCRRRRWAGSAGRCSRGCLTTTRPSGRCRRCASWTGRRRRGVWHAYRVIAVNGVGLRSEPSGTARPRDRRSPSRFLPHDDRLPALHS